MNDEIVENIKKLKIQDFLFVVFAIVSFLFLSDFMYYSNNTTFLGKISSTITKLLIPTKLGLNSMMINIKRNSLLKSYEAYKNISNEKKDLYFIKLYGSCFFIAGAICLLYFQEKQTSFIGGPAT